MRECEMARFYCGACGWSYPHWKSTFYNGVPQEDWLRHYASRFDTVEINNSFYQLPDIETFADWFKSTPDDFTFAIKASRYLTHMKKLKDPRDPRQLILDHSAPLGKKRGPILYQLPPNWNVNLERLEAFLEILPAGVRHVFEFRNDTWQTEAVWSLLDGYGVAYCIMDSPGLPKHLKTTADFSYVRMHSGGEKTGGNYTESALSKLAGRVEEMLERGDVYVYFNNDIHTFAVQNALSLKKKVLGS